MPKDERYACGLCDKSYANRSSLSRHKSQKHPDIVKVSHLGYVIYPTLSIEIGVTSCWI